MDPFGVKLVNPPPISICPFDSGMTAFTVELGVGLNGPSSVPSGFSLAMYKRGKPSTNENDPPMRICPLDWTAIAWTGPSTVVLNVLSSVPSALSLAK